MDKELNATARKRRGSEALINNTSLFLSLTQDGLHILDSEGYVILVSDSFCRMLGYTREEMEGMHLSTWEARYSGESLKQAIQAVFDTPSGEMCRFETLHRKKDGTVLPVEITSTPFEIEGNRFTFNSSRDISTRVAREKEILSLKENLQGTLDALPDLLFEVDDEGRFHGFHAGSHSLLFPPPEAFLGKTLGEVLPPEVADLGGRLIREAKERGSATGSYHLPLPQGDVYFDVRAVAKKIGTPDLPGSSRFLFLSRDVTERVRITRRLELLLGSNTFLAQANQILARQTNPEAALREFSALAQGEGGFSLVAFLEITEDRKNLTLRTAAGMDPDISSRLSELFPLSFSDAGWSEPSGEEDVAAWGEGLQDSGSPLVRRLKAMGTESLAAFPLFRGEVFWGVLVLGDPHTGAFPEERLTVLRELARDLSRAFERIEAQARERQLLAVREAILQSTLSGIAILKDRTIVLANERMATMLGYQEAREIIGQPTRIVYFDEDEYRSAGERIYPKIYTSGEVRIEDLRAKKKDGSLLWLDTSTVHVQAGEESLILVTLHDATHRHLQAERLARLSDFNALLAQASEILYTSPNEPSLLRDLTALALERTKMVLVWIGAPGDDGVFEFRAVAGNTDILQQFGPISSRADSPYGQGPAARAWRTKKFQYEGDFSRMATGIASPYGPIWAEVARRHGIRSVAALPLFRNGALWGVLTLYHRAETLFDDEFRTLLAELAHNISRGLDRLDLIERERFISQQQKILLDTTSAGIAILRDRKISYVNPRFLALFGYASPDQLVGQTSRPLYPDEAEYQRVRTFYSRLDTATTFEIPEVRFLKTDGSVFYCDLTAGILSEATDKKSSTLIVTLHDVTERHMQARRLARLSSFRDLLSRVNQTLAAVDREETLFQDVCDRIVSTGEVSLAWIGRPDESGIVRYLGMAGATNFLEGLEISVLPSHPSGQGSVGECFRKGHPLFNADLRRNAATTPWKETVERSGFQSVATLPIFRGGKVFGVFTLYQTRPEGFDSDLQELLSEMAGQISAGLDRLDIRRDKNLLADAVGAVGEGIMVLNPGRTVDFANEAAAHLLGFEGKSLMGQPFSSLIRTKEGESPLRKILLAMDREAPFQGEVEIPGSDGHSRWILMGLTPARNREGKTTHFVLVLRDITNIIDLTKRFEHEALHDSLTGLPNRRALDATLERNLARADRTKTPLAVAILDLDDFKPVNDTWGHPAGDTLLREISARFSASLRGGDFLARIGGDEFALILDLTSDLPLEDQVVAFAARIHRAVEIPFEVEPEQHATVGMSMGVAFFPRDGESPDALLRQADQSLYQAKSHKMTRDRWWQSGGGQVSEREAEIDDLFGENARRLLESHRETLESVAREFVRTFYLRLGENPEDRKILDTLTQEERGRLEASQVEHLTNLLSPEATRKSLRLRSERAGETHALCGVETSRILHGENVYADLLAEKLARTLYSPSERHGILRIAEGRLRSDIEIQLRVQSSIVETYLATLFLSPPPSDTPWKEALKQFLTSLEALPGIRGTLIIRPDSAGIYRVESGPALQGEPLLKTLQRHLESAEGQLSGEEQAIVAFETRDIATLPSSHHIKSPQLRDILLGGGVRSALHIPILDALGQASMVITLLGAYPNQFESRWTRLFAQGISGRVSRIAREDDLMPPSVDEATARIYRAELFSGGLTVFYQPVVDLTKGTTHKFEALARLVLTDGTVVSPGRFLPLLGRPEQDRLFRAVLDRALEFATTQRQMGRTLSLSVNIPPETLRNTDCPRWVEEALSRHSLPPAQLTLEILENEKILHPDQFAAIRTLAKIGVRLSMDDLGSGYSSLERLSTLPFSTIKIDQNLVLRIRQAPTEVLGLVTTLLQLGRELSQEVIVEGLEDPGMVEAMFFLGVPLGQGYALARPMPAEKAQSYLETPPSPLAHDRITTWLGALTTHWKLMRDYTNHGLKIGALSSCPLTAFLAERAPEAEEAIEWHKEFHRRKESRKKVSAILIEWLAERVVSEGVSKEPSGADPEAKTVKKSGSSRRKPDTGDRL
ncbi:MAG: PAS domain S-box protein [Leptospirillia bacterium]